LFTVTSSVQKAPSGGPQAIEMLSAIFIVNKEGIILIEKQYRERVQRSEIDLACDAIREKTRTPPGIIPHGEYSILLHLQDEIWLVGVCEGDEFALFGVSVLQYVGELFAGLLHDGATEISVKVGYHVVYQILDFAVDAGFPFLNQSNTILHLLTHPQTDYAKGNRLVLDLQRPWRIVGPKYSHNEILVDVIEMIDLIVRQDSRVEFCHIRGSVDVVCRLSDAPRCRLILQPSSRWEDVTFHRCCEVETSDTRVIPFLPPDGKFTLMKYRITALAANLPLAIVPKFRWLRAGVHCDVTIRKGSNLVKPLEDVELRFELPQGVHQPTLTVTIGKATFDQSACEVVWAIKSFSSSEPTSLMGTATTDAAFDIGGRFPIVTARFNTTGA
jgi:hypothetical protein